MKKLTILGVLVMVLAIVGTFAWESFGREEVMFTEVLVFNQDVEAYTTVTKDMLTVTKVNQAYGNSYVEADVDKVIGKQTTQFVPLGCQLQERFFTEPKLVADRTSGEYVYSLTVSTLKSYPRSIAKGDNVAIYCGENLLFNTTVLGLRDSNGNEVNQGDNRAVATGVIASVEILTDVEQAGTLSKLFAMSEAIAIVYN